MIKGYVKALLGVKVRSRPIDGRILYILPWKSHIVIYDIVDNWGYIKGSERGRHGWVSMNSIMIKEGHYIAQTRQMLTRFHYENPNEGSNAWNIGSFMHYRLQDNPKMNKPHAINLGKVTDSKSWAYYIRSLNTPEVWHWMVDEEGTSKLLASPDGGSTITIPAQLLGGAENIVNVSQSKNGFTEIIGLSIYDDNTGYMLGNPPDAEKVNYLTHPDLVHRIVGCDVSGEPFIPKWGAAYMPVINPRGMKGSFGQSKIWIETRFLTELRETSRFTSQTF